MAWRADRRLHLFTRNGNDWSELFPAVVAAVKALDVRSCLIDGEVVVCDEQGLAVFDLLRRGSRVKDEAHLYAFDLLELDGRDLMRAPIEERKHELGRLLQKAAAGVQLCAHLDQPGDVVFDHAYKLGCEGIVSKRVGSKYRRTGSR
jgi:bifunctional non-homologous end joining protein LigD